MPPNNLGFVTPVSNEGLETTELKREPYKPEYIKKYVFVCILIHLSALYGLYLGCTEAKWKTIVLEYLLYLGAILGITAGAHRLWSHRSYKATLPLQLLLTYFTSLAFQFSTITWVRDHRSHHKFSDTDGDPHNSKRGFFFSHIGWLMMTKHPDVKRRGKTIDLSDVYCNPVLRFQHENFFLCCGLAAFILPTLIPLLWEESLNVSWHLCILRYALSTHSIMMVNSFAHMFGNKPYDKHIAATQCHTVSIVTLGEAFHNFHHAFPLDYRSAELGNNRINFTTMFIEFFAWIGWAYDLKTVSSYVVKGRMEKCGDGSSS